MTDLMTPNRKAYKKLFYDIETHYRNPLPSQSELIKAAFEGHYYDPNDERSIDEQFMEKAGLNPEFGQVVCISFGYEDPNTMEFKKKTLCGDTEVDILTGAAEIIEAMGKAGYGLVGWNSDSFDSPFLQVRMMIRGIHVPKPLNTAGLKPWEGANEDAMKLWKLGRWTNTSLQAASACLGIASKSEEVDGKSLYLVPIEQMDWNELGKYCEEDVWVCYQIYDRMYKYIYG